MEEEFEGRFGEMKGVKTMSAWSPMVSTYDVGVCVRVTGQGSGLFGRDES